MKLEDFDLRNKEFREFLIECINYHCYCYGNENYNKILSLLEKEKITNNDIIKIMFYFQNTENLFSFKDEFFDYKITKIQADRKNKFIEIIKKEVPEFEVHDKLNSHVQLLDVINKKGNISSVEKIKLFNELIDIFLDEI
jgi:hypothetical protein